MARVVMALLAGSSAIFTYTMATIQPSFANAAEFFNSLLVALHSDYDRLDPGQSSSGSCFGSTSSSMLRAALGCRLMKPARSSVTTIW